MFPFDDAIMVYELINLEVLKIFTSKQNTNLLIYGYDILCEISNGIFEIPHKISYSYFERYVFL